MYEEKRVRFDWKGFLLKLLIALLLIFLILMLLPFGNKKEANGHTKAFNDNFSKIKEVGNNYYTKDNLPAAGEESKITLRQLINSKKVKTLKGADKKVCNEDASYIKSYKKNIGYELEVHLECGEEKETTYIYLGCFDDCSVKPTTTTTTTTTKKKTTTTKKSNNGGSSSSSETKKTTKKTTTTTTRVKKYAVIFNENGGTKVATQNVIAGRTATLPTNPTKEGYSFAGWYLNDKPYNFNTPVNSNIVLIAKWFYNDHIGVLIEEEFVKTGTYNQTLYGVITADINSSKLNTKATLNIPEEIQNRKNQRIKSITYIRNFSTEKDITDYLSNRASVYAYEEAILNSYNINNFGIIDNIEISKYSNGYQEKAIKWSGNSNKKCTNPINNECAYGIVYRVIWEFDY